MRIIGSGEDLPGPQLCPAPRRRDYHGTDGNRDPGREFAGIRYDAGDPRGSDLDLWSREITNVRIWPRVVR